MPTCSPARPPARQAKQYQASLCGGRRRKCSSLQQVAPSPEEERASQQVALQVFALMSAAAAAAAAATLLARPNEAGRRALRRRPINHALAGSLPELRAARHSALLSGQTCANIAPAIRVRNNVRARQQVPSRLSRIWLLLLLARTLLALARSWPRSSLGSSWASFERQLQSASAGNQPKCPAQTLLLLGQLTPCQPASQPASWPRV